MQIIGQYFGNTQGNSYVLFNAQQAQIVTWTASAITCLVPNVSQSGSVSVIVMVDGTRPSNTLTFNVTSPAISSISPSSDNVGAVVSITGSGFGQNQSLVNGYLTIGGQTAQILSWSDTLIQFAVPPVANSGVNSLVLTVNGKHITDSFRVEAPVASSQSPNPVGKGQILTISGNYFGQSTDNVSRTVSIEGYGFVTPVTYNDTTLSFAWPVDNTIFGTQQKTVTISIGGLTTTIVITAD